MGGPPPNKPMKLPVAFGGRLSAGRWTDTQEVVVAKKLKVFLPRWVLWILVPMLALIWGIITYAALATPSGREELGIVGWLGVTLVLVLVGVMFWLMASGRLPAYIIEEIEDADDSTKP